MENLVASMFQLAVMHFQKSFLRHRAVTPRYRRARLEEFAVTAGGCIHRNRERILLNVYNTGDYHEAVYYVKYLESIDYYFQKFVNNVTD